VSLRSSLKGVASSRSCYERELPRRVVMSWRLARAPSPN